MTEMEYLSRVYCATWKLEDDNGDFYIRGMRDALQTLSAREQLALELRYREGMTYKMVGQQIGGVTAERARHIVQTSMRKLRHLPSDIYTCVSQIIEQNDKLKQLLKEKNALIDEQRDTIMQQKAVIKEKQTIITIINEQQAWQYGWDINAASNDPDPSELKIADIPFLTRTHHALASAGITEGTELIAYRSFHQLSYIRNIGFVSLIDIIKNMYELGYRGWVRNTLRNTNDGLRGMIKMELEKVLAFEKSE